MAIAKWMGFGSVQPAATETISEGQTKVKRVYGADYKQFGLENFGNTCYANSVLQALYFCHPFRELVMQAPDRSNVYNQSTIVPLVLPATPAAPPPLTRMKTGRKQSTTDVRPGSQQAPVTATAESTGPPIPASPPTLYSALRSLFIHIANNGLDNGIVAPRAFVDKVKKENELFRGTMHQDAHEFFNYLLNKVSEELEEEVKAQPAEKNGSSGEDEVTSLTVLSPPGPPITVYSQRMGVYNLFEGVLTSETRCLTCENVSTRDEAFLDLSIDIEQNSSVTACLRQFSASEMLCQKNKFFCDGCCGLQEAEKRMKIKKLPNVLALHLKRFKYQEELQKYIKLAYRVVFPFELRLFNTVDNTDNPDRLYELFAIIVHIGNGPNQGHYISIVKSRGSWHVFDDDTVEKIKEADIAKYFGESNSGAAYVLYYQAMDLDLAALGLRTHPEPSAKSQSTTPPQVPSSPTLEAPLLPPGLTNEGDSDLTSSPASMIAGSPPNFTPPSLTLSIPAVPELPAPPPFALAPPATPVTPTVASPNGKSGNFFSSLRHTPSVRANGHSRLSTYSNATASPSLPEHKVVIPRAVPVAQTPSIPQQAPKEPVSPLFVASSPRVGKDKDVNGKAKAPKERSSGWFSKRRSIKTEKIPDPSISTPSTATQNSSTTVSDDSAPLMSAPLPVTKRTSEKPATLRHSSHLTPAALLGTSSPELKVPPREGSMRSSLSSGSRSGSPSVVPEEQSTTANILGSPRTQSPVPLSAALRPEHKKSQPALGDRHKHLSRDTPKRPHTANATPTSHHTFTMGVVPVPVPPISADVSRSTQTPGRTLRDGHGTRRPTSSQDRMSTSAPVFAPQARPPSRKLSLSSGMSNMTGMLGFGKKDKHKEKDKLGYHAHQDNRTGGPANESVSTSPGRHARTTVDSSNGLRP